MFGFLKRTAPQPGKRMVAGTAAAALAVILVGGFEGLRTVSYRDIVGVPTLCYGETRGIRMGMTATKTECDAMLLKGLGEFADGIERCVPALKAAPDSVYVANLSLAYNIGEGAYCKSTVARRFAAGDVRGSCDAFLMWNKAGGRVVAGLDRRRREERALCLKDL
jgi:lysozyme